jgi:hypothetical protein
MIKKLSYTFGSKSKAQEVILLLHGAKKIVRQGFYEHQLPKIEKFCMENKLSCVKSKFKVLLADETSFSNKGIRVPSDDHREGMYFVYISKDEKKAWLASYYELMSNDADLGYELGYPKCCIEFFCSRFSESNPNLQQKPTNAFTNISKRSQDNVIISHFPCSSSCEASIDLGKKYLDVLMSVDNERVEELLKNLSVQ